MNWQSEHIWIELIPGSQKTSHFCWAFLLFLGSLGFLVVGISRYLGRNLLSIFLSQQILFFPQGIVMSFYGWVKGLLRHSQAICLKSHFVPDPSHVF
ncbi:Photosystem I assembly protein Ycf4 [Platanthera guangdongensis]|uniref:Photosystem I assembly protein Ycf4 n=1 Tax=Platanthera guangdongensis TaxID=2320717 RepID=A0ABR2MKU4_9ASPA